MIAFTQFDTIFLSKPTDATRFTPGEDLYLFRAGAPVSQHPMTVSKSDDCMGWLKVSDPHRVCSKAQRGDDLRKEVRQ